MAHASLYVATCTARGVQQCLVLVPLILQLKFSSHGDAKLPINRLEERQYRIGRGSPSGWFPYKIPPFLGAILKVV